MLSENTPYSIQQNSCFILKSCLLQTCGVEMVQDIIHACQGIDGRLVRLTGATSGDTCYQLTDEGHEKLSTAQKSIMMQLCELGWLYRYADAQTVPQLILLHYRELRLRHTGLTYICSLIR